MNFLKNKGTFITSYDMFGYPSYEKTKPLWYLYICFFIVMSGILGGVLAYYIIVTRSASQVGIYADLMYLGTPNAISNINLNISACYTANFSVTPTCNAYDIPHSTFDTAFKEEPSTIVVQATGSVSLQNATSCTSFIGRLLGNANSFEYNNSNIYGRVDTSSSIYSCAKIGIGNPYLPRANITNFDPTLTGMAYNFAIQETITNLIYSPIFNVFQIEQLSPDNVLITITNFATIDWFSPVAGCQSFVIGHDCLPELGSLCYYREYSNCPTTREVPITCDTYPPYSSYFNANLNTSYCCITENCLQNGLYCTDPCFVNMTENIYTMIPNLLVVDSYTFQFLFDSLVSQCEAQVSNTFALVTYNQHNSWLEIISLAGSAVLSAHTVMMLVLHQLNQLIQSKRIQEIERQKFMRDSSTNLATTNSI